MLVETEDIIVETKKLIDVLLDMKKKLNLTYQQLADIWQVSLSTAKSKLRGDSRVTMRDMTMLVEHFGYRSYICIEPGVEVYIHITTGKMAYNKRFYMDLT